MRHIGTILLETPRLILRRFRPEDAGQAGRNVHAIFPGLQQRILRKSKKGSPNGSLTTNPLIITNGQSNMTPTKP